MQKSFDLFFATSNDHKYEEARLILDSFGINLGLFKCNLEEIQSDSIKQIASKKAKYAYSKCKKPVIVEDDGLTIDSLNQFPGPYSSYVFKTLGNKGILNLLTENRDADFISVIAYCDNNSLHFFEAKLAGTISTCERGNGWGFDPIFIPKNTKKTFAEIENKNKISHRYKALKIFSRWYLNK